jgi:hypothetical protein
VRFFGLVTGTELLVMADLIASEPAAQAAPRVGA